MATLVIIPLLPTLHPKDGQDHQDMEGHPLTVVRHPVQMPDLLVHTDLMAIMVLDLDTHHHQAHLRVLLQVLLHLLLLHRPRHQVVHRRQVALKLVRQAVHLVVLAVRQGHQIKTHMDLLGHTPISIR